jgi:hypothetical protein
MKNGVFWVVTPRGSCKNQEPHGVTTQNTPFFIIANISGCTPSSGASLGVRANSLQLIKAGRFKYKTANNESSIVSLLLTNNLWKILAIDVAMNTKIRDIREETALVFSLGLLFQRSEF